MMNPFVLCDAVKLVIGNKGSAGIDQITCQQIKGHEWEFAKGIAGKLRSGAYRARVVRRVYIPKRDGRERPLGIPTVEDRAIQRALVLLLEPIYELVFLPNSYGFRRGQSGVECVSVTANEVYRHRWVLEADIEGFFDSVSHRKLLGMLKEKIVDRRIHNLIQSFLLAGYVERGKPWHPTWRGTPQGGPLSPMLANIYLHYALDVRFQRHSMSGEKLIRYADDFIIMSRQESSIRTLKGMLDAWMQEAGLKLKEAKTRIVNMSNHKRSRNSHFDFLGFRFHLRAFNDNPKRFWVARQPSERARLALRKNLKSKLKPQLNPLQAAIVVAEVWRGWCQYFRFGNSNRIFYRECRTVHKLVSYYLRDKYRQGRRPVRWKKLAGLEKRILRGIKPLRVIPNYLCQQAVLV